MTKEDLQAIRELMQEELKPVKDDLKRVDVKLEPVDIKAKRQQ